ncbi:MAG: 30S ribosomal protein S9 [Candidatus Kaiserbacteria bacterium]|nr:30S ribosomal protein S9 [Candidatus Kaiserbacteria bacterium]MCB9816029.1 30S ribosomal protein S9 [Candidatus Nomurabacteria bacterium]
MSATKTVYVEGIGRRKTATARVRLTPASKTEIIVNDKPVAEYFQNLSHQKDIQSVLDTKDAGIQDYTITAKVLGGGISAQAEAIRLGIARALVKEKADRRSALKAEGFLMRDPRSVERKKFGLRKARKRPAWSKR